LFAFILGVGVVTLAVTLAVTVVTILLVGAVAITVALAITVVWLGLVVGWFRPSYGPPSG
jgi:hypothetical protein